MLIICSLQLYEAVCKATLLGAGVPSAAHQPLRHDAEPGVLGVVTGALAPGDAGVGRGKACYLLDYGCRYALI